MQRMSCKHTYREDMEVYFKLSRDSERDPCSARTSVAYGNGSCSKEKQLLVKMLIPLDAAFESPRRAIRNNTSDNSSSTFWFLVCTPGYFLCECVFPPSLCRLKFITTGRRVDVENESKNQSERFKTSCKVNFGKTKKNVISYSCHLSPRSANKRRASVWRFCFLLHVLNAIP